MFVSVQGEGPYVGYRQLFIRFPKCNLNCLYCDTPKEWENDKKCHVEKAPGSGEFEEIENPLSVARVTDIIAARKRLHSVSLTGGEPLLYAAFIKELKGVRTPLYLESNMTLPEGAKDVKDIVRYVSGDFKLEGQCDFKGQYEKFFNATARSYSILRKTSFRDCFCKMIVTEDFSGEAMMHALDQIKGCISTLILQPVTPTGEARAASPAQVMKLQDMAMDLIEDVRIIPQTHKLWGCL
ncbi:MAG: 7-carboxy-7-deazaguanine synthase [Methanocella sp. PtaU1.Bin125]|nr:MAG: 7-carboxy-7-deazaguanine synthase [Methanocella sp. PtaU1.Bin125]